MKKILFLAFTIFTTACGLIPNCEKLVNEKVRPQEINGIVVTKIEGGRFGEVIVQQGKQLDTLRDIPIYNTTDDKDLWYNIHLTDSIYKAKGETLVSIVNVFGTRVVNFHCEGVR